LFGARGSWRAFLRGQLGGWPGYLAEQSKVFRRLKASEERLKTLLCAAKPLARMERLITKKYGGTNAS